MLQGNFFTIRTIEPEEGLIRARLEINPAHHIFKGHFPSIPVVPGVCMLQMVKETIENVIGRDTRLERSDHMKFLAVINPVEINMVQLDIRYTLSEKRQIIVVATIFNGEVTYFKFKGLFHT